MVRSAGKFGKPRRGGGKHFSRDLAKLDGGGPAEKEGMWGDGGGEEDSEEGSEEEDSDEDESDEEATPASGSAAGKAGIEDRFASASLGNDQPTTVSRADRKAAKKKVEENEEDDDLLNPNRSAPKTVKTGDIGKSAQPMSRREREAAEKKAAQERYMKLHLAGKTDQAKSDLARLAQIKAQREAAAATRKAEADAKAKESAERIASSSRKKH